MSFLCNQLVRTICPCLFSKKKDLSHFGDNELIQKQQFMVPDSMDHDYEIKHRMQINSKFQQQTLSSESSSRTTFTSKPNESDTLSNPNEQQNQTSGLMAETLIQQPIQYNDYTDVIPQTHSYYDILYPKLQMLSTLFHIDEKHLLQVSTQPFPLKIYCRQSEVKKTNSFIYFFQFANTNYESYESLLNNFELQKSFDSNINQYYKKVESPNNETKVIYLSYNKVLIIAPRDFVYVRYVFKKGKEFWSVATSLPNQQQIKGKIRGQIVLTATKVVEQDNKIQVQVYSEVNMKMAIKPQMAKNRGKTQIKKYLQKCHKYLNENKSENIL